MQKRLIYSALLSGTAMLTIVLSPPYKNTAQTEAVVVSTPATLPNLPYAESFVLSNGEVLAGELSGEDAKRYWNIKKLQESGKWEEADAIISDVKNPVLMGYVLAKRYQDYRYKPSNEELTKWFATYSDLPQARALYDYALQHGVEAAALPAIAPKKLLAGFGAGVERGDRSPIGGGNAEWQQGLSAWKAGEVEAAATHFSTMAETTQGGDQAAASFWAYRAYHKLGDEDQANHYLQTAAADTHGFYGVLAKKVLGESLNKTYRLPESSADTVAEFTKTPAVKRGIALMQIGEEEKAEAEMRQAYMQVSKGNRKDFLALVTALKMPALEISIARSMAHDGETYEAALYPAPAWKPENGFKLDPALLFAFARQESGFRPYVEGAGGAIGLMQLMPATARAMHTSTMGTDMQSPITNLLMGEAYLKHLMETPLVGDNLVYLTAAYNAGPGKVQEWKARGYSDADPLLFIESIPYVITRHYVMQVLTNYWIYQELAGEPANSAKQIISGDWPTYGKVKTASAE